MWLRLGLVRVAPKRTYDCLCVCVGICEYVCACVCMSMCTYVCVCAYVCHTSYIFHI